MNKAKFPAVTRSATGATGAASDARNLARNSLVVQKVGTSREGLLPSASGRKMELFRTLLQRCNVNFCWVSLVNRRNSLLLPLQALTALTSGPHCTELGQ